MNVQTTECPVCPKLGLIRCSHYGSRVVALYEFISGGQKLGVWHVCHPPCEPPTPQDSIFRDFDEASKAYEAAEIALREAAS